MTAISHVEKGLSNWNPQEHRTFRFTKTEIFNRTKRLASFFAARLRKYHDSILRQHSHGIFHSYEAARNDP